MERTWHGARKRGRERPDQATYSRKEQGEAEIDEGREESSNKGDEKKKGNNYNVVII